MMRYQSVHTMCTPACMCALARPGRRRDGTGVKSTDSKCEKGSLVGSTDVEGIESSRQSSRHCGSTSRWYARS
jgi:hypothetical protein